MQMLCNTHFSLKGDPRQKGLLHLEIDNNGIFNKCKMYI